MDSSDTQAIHASSGDIESKQHVGQGILGEIFVAKHRHWGPIWIKEVALQTPVTTNVPKKLRKEAEVLKNLRHKNIVQLMGVIWEPLPKYYALIFEPARYGILAEFLEMNPGLDVSLKVSFMYDVALGLSYLHSIRPPVIHRDLRWNLVHVQEHFHLKISDFGLAEWINYSRSHSNHRYSHGPTYHIAPECWRDINLKPSSKTDMYSFAVLCWSIAVQEEPYRNLVSAEQIRAAVIEGQRPSLEDLPEDCNTPQLRNWLTHWWAQDPEQRPHCHDVAALLEQYTKEYEREINEAKIRLHRGANDQSDAAAVQVSVDGVESLGEAAEQPSFNLNACATERINKVNPVDFSFSGSDSTSQNDETAVKRRSASQVLEDNNNTENFQGRNNDLEVDADESQDKAGHLPNTSSEDENTTSAKYASASTNSSCNGNILRGPPTYAPTASGNINVLNGQSRYASTTSNNGSTNFGSDQYNLRSDSSSSKPLSDMKVSESWRVQSSQPAGMYTVSTEGGSTSVYNFGQNLHNIQIGEGNVMHVTTKVKPQKGKGQQKSMKSTSCRKDEKKKYTITSSKKVLDDKNLDMLKRHLGKEWKDVARKLGFPEGEIDAIEHDHHTMGLKEIIHKFLDQWREKMGNQATLCAMADALIELKLYDIATQLDSSQ